MEFKDEKIIRLRNDYKSKLNKDIYRGATIKGQLTHFERIVITPETCSIMMPDNFHTMDPEIAQFKYPSQWRPQVIKTSPMNDVDLSFSFQSTELTAEDMLYYKDKIKTTLHTVQPAMVFYQEGIHQAAHGQIGYLAFESYAIGAKIYNFKFVTVIARQLIIATFNCHHDDKGEWEIVARQMMQSLESLAKGKDGGES